MLEDKLIIFLRGVMKRFYPELKLSEAEQGFTLIELIITLVFAGIILAIAVPSFNTMIRNNRLSSEANNLVAALNLARSEAVTRGDRVTVCRSLDGANCNAAAGNWEDGWIVFHDPLNSGTVGVVDTVAGVTEELIRVYPAVSDALTLRTGALIDDYVSFLPQGQVRVKNGGIGNDTFRLCDSRGVNFAYSVSIIATGRLVTSRTALQCP